MVLIERNWNFEIFIETLRAANNSIAQFPKKTTTNKIAITKAVFLGVEPTAKGHKVYMKERENKQNETAWKTKIRYIQFIIMKDSNVDG